MIGALSLLAAVFPALGDRPWLECESTYLGDGWFRYRAGSRLCPFISALTLEGVYTGTSGLDPLSWTEEMTPPYGWHDSTNNPLGAWEADDQLSGWQNVPYDAVFEVRSSLTNYQQGAVTITMSLMLFEQGVPGGVYSANVVGYWNAPALVPCLPDQQDYSPNPLYTNLSYTDIVISDLIRDSNGVHGVTFTNYEFEGTYVLEASPDLKVWRRVAYIYSQPSVTTWTTNVDLGQWGNYFRLDYVGYGEITGTNLPPLDTKLLSGAKSFSQPAVVKRVPQVAFSQPGRLKVCLRTTPGRNYLVRVYDAGKVVWTAQCAAAQSRTILDLPAADLPRMGIVRADELP